MPLKLICRILFILMFTSPVFSQEKKSVEALFITTPVKIDAVLDEQVYKEAKPAKDFVQLQPYNGKPSFQPSEVYFLYDQDAIYVGAMLYDSSPDSIFNYFSERDQIGMSDYFGVYFDPYNQGQLAFGFFITPQGVQSDIKALKKEYDNEDGSWDAVWESKTAITDKGWIVEMRIPYSAIRFPEKEVHTWGLNMFRNIRRYNSNNSWNFVNREVSGFIHQQGLLTGIKNIKPPVRLSFSPYAAAYAEFKEGSGSPELIYKGGMDLKYGISESFTLDMMLIPDFGQIQSDDQELNLSPYEIYYDERRQFFTEGIELFERAGAFYSRRIGTRPKFSSKAEDDLSDNEIVDYSPSETQLINATKVSGRTSNGWGVGFLNAMSLPSYATIKDTLSGDSRNFLIQPFTNYNVSVIDKSLKNNSYIGLINTNMGMVNSAFVANVTATDFQIRDKSKNFAVSGKAAISYRGEEEKETGYFAELGLAKNSGKFQYGVKQSLNTDKFNINDLGYMRRNNEMITNFSGSYQKVEPFWIFREFQSEFWWIHTRIYKPNDVFGNEIGIWAYTLFKNNYRMEVNGGIETVKHDYYETRVEGRYYEEPYNFWCNMGIGTDSRKPVNFYFHFGGFNKVETDQYGFWGYDNATFRIGQRLQLSYEIEYQNLINDRGYVDHTDSEDTIYFAKRDVRFIENVFNATFGFTNNANIRFRLRHYWSGAVNKNFYQLQQNGTLIDDLNYSENHDENYNAFTIDMIFRWIFAPGSEISIAWKNAIYKSQDNVIPNYWDNIERTWKSEQANSLSVKILYYIDYNSLRKKK
ncbi:MAG: carbohydrate binding family 9 domain-containing protein [Bacteroidales bacterium]|nr:carbohydrate binding family 9 domain-containing protein [Bacteroidales bacterium]